MTGSDLQVVEVAKRRDLAKFVRFPWQMYRHDPYWVAPLVKDQFFLFGPSHPFRQHSEMKLFLARKGTELVGRIGGIVDHNYTQFHQEKTGFFGFFEAIPDPRVAEALFSRVSEWLKAEGMTKLIGPMNPSTNYECGLLVEPFDIPPCMMMPYNRSYYPKLIEGSGLEKVMDLYAYIMDESTVRYDRLARIAEKIREKQPDLHFRPINLESFDQELNVVKQIYDDAWSKNWGFVPMTELEVDHLAKMLKPLIVPGMALFAYWNDEPIGFAATLPNYNEVLMHLNGKLGLVGALKALYYSRKIKGVRMMLLGVKQAFQKRGVESLLYMESLKEGLRLGYKWVEFSWILESNVLTRHAVEREGGRHYKTYRIYQCSL